MRKDLMPRQSTNIEERQREFPRPMAGSHIGGENIHKQDATAYDTWGKQRIKATLQSKGNDFGPMLKDMQKLPAQMKKDDQANLRSGQNPNVPIPTPRPDPNAPYQQPTVFNKDNGKG